MFDDRTVKLLSDLTGVVGRRFGFLLDGLAAIPSAQGIVQRERDQCIAEIRELLFSAAGGHHGPTSSDASVRMM